MRRVEPGRGAHPARCARAWAALVMGLLLFTLAPRAPATGAGLQADDFDDLDNPDISFVVSGDFDPDRLRISTDKSQYVLGESLRFCYTVPAPGEIAIFDLLPNGQRNTVLSGYDDGRGDCIAATVTPPTGRECLRIRYFFSGGGSWSRQTCFDVLGGAAPGGMLPGPATGQYLRVSVGSAGTATLTWQSTPAGSGEWVSVVPAGAPDSRYDSGRWRYTADPPPGRFTVMGLTPGDYEARLYRDSGYTVIDRVRFRVAEGMGPVAGPGSGMPATGGLAADYRFQSSLASSVGSPPALTNLGEGANRFVSERVDGLDRTVLAFPAGNGVTLAPTTGVIANSGYSVVVLFRFDAIDGFRRILDFKNGGSESGLYNYGGHLSLYPNNQAYGRDATITANSWVQLVLTRSSAGTVAGYVNGVQQFSVPDTDTNAVIGPENVLRFFRDDGSEHAAGAVARIRLYNRALTPDEVAALDRLP